MPTLSDTTPAWIPGACPHDCPDRCSWQVKVEDGTAVELIGDKLQPFTRGVLCAKVDHYLDRVYSPDRVLHPLRRVGAKGDGKFERVGWDEAIADVAARLHRLIDRHGATTVLPYSYMGTQGIVQTSSLDRRFFARLGATRLERNICASTAGRGIVATLGATTGMLPEDIAHSRFIILWGTNTVVTNLHLWPFIRQARAAGATVVVIDPLRTRTAAQADWHLRPLPGTDAALALGMMHVIVNEDLHDKDYVARHTLGFDRLCARLDDYPPERVAAITGLEADDVMRLARAYAETQPSAIRMLVGMEHHAHGAMAFRTIACLPALVGAWRHRGGGIVDFTAKPHYQALNVAGAEKRELEDRSIRSVNMVQLGEALTSEAMAPPIHALIVYNSNPAVIAPNLNRVRAGLAREDLFTVVHEQFLTDTARYADYVFPATTQVEHLDLLWSWGHTYVTLNRPAIATARRGSAEHRILPPSGRRPRPAGAGLVRIRRKPRPHRPGQRPSLPGRRHLRAPVGTRLGAAQPARRLATFCQRRLPHALRQVRVLRRAPAISGVGPPADVRARQRKPRRRRRAGRPLPAAANDTQDAPALPQFKLRQPAPPSAC